MHGDGVRSIAMCVLKKELGHNNIIEFFFSWIFIDLYTYY